MFCMKCGQVLEDGVRFCPVCGTAVEQAENPVNEAAEQAFAAGTEDMSYAPAEEAVQGAYAYGEQAAEEAASFDYGAEPEQPVYGAEPEQPAYGAYAAGAAEAAYGYAEPTAGAAVEDAAVKKPKGVGSLVCGIIGLVLCWIPIVGVVLGIIGLILGIRAFKRGARGMAIAGIILSAIALVFGLIITIIMGIGIAAVVTGMSGSYGIPGLMELEDLIDQMGVSGSGSYGGTYKMKAMMDIIARIK